MISAPSCANAGIGLHVTEQGIDTYIMEGRTKFGMLSVCGIFSEY